MHKRHMPFMQRATARDNTFGLLVRINYSHVQLNHHIPTDYDIRIWGEKKRTNKVQVQTLITGEKMYTHSMSATAK